MNIVFINNSMETFTPTRSGALATIIWECCRAAASEGTEPVVITRRCLTAAPFEWPATITVEHPEEPTGKFGVLLRRVERKALGWRHLRQREWSDRVLNEIRKRGLGDSVFVLMNDPELAVLVRSRFPESRVIHWFQNQLTCKERFRRAFAGSVDVVLGVSDFTSRWIEQYYGLASGQVQTLYNAVNLEAFHPAEQEPPGPVVINFVGRTGIEKAPDVVLKAALEIVGGGRDFALQLIGSNHWDRFEMDAFQKELSDLADELEKRGVTVRRPGHVDRKSLPAELRKAHIHVTPSRWDEPFGMTTVEGMASGLATIASRTGGTPEIVEGHGLLFERDSVAQLAAAFDKLIGDAKLRREYGQKARARAEHFTWARVWDGLKAAAEQPALVTTGR